MYVRFTWDEKKKKANRKKHGVSFETAQSIFDDPFHIVIDNYLIDGEQRVQAIGKSQELLLIAAIFLDRSEDSDQIVIHLISARKATAYEQAIYEDQFR